MPLDRAMEAGFFAELSQLICTALSDFITLNAAQNPN
jgi:hypothetical protein